MKADVISVIEDLFSNKSSWAEISRTYLRHGSNDELFHCEEVEVVLNLKITSINLSK